MTIETIPCHRPKAKAVLVLVLAAVGCSAATTIGANDGGTGGIMETGGTGGIVPTGGTVTGGTVTGGTVTGGIAETGGLAVTGGAQTTGGANPAGGTGGANATGGARTGGVGGFVPYACSYTYSDPPATGGHGASNGTGGFSGTGGAYGATPLSPYCDPSCPAPSGLIEPQTVGSARAVLARRWRWCTASRPLFDIDQSVLEIGKDDTFTVYDHWTWSPTTGTSMPGPVKVVGTVTYGAPGSSELTLAPMDGKPFTVTVVIGSLPESKVELIIDSGPNQGVYLGL